MKDPESNCCHNCQHHHVEYARGETMWGSEYCDKKMTGPVHNSYLDSWIERVDCKGFVPQETRQHLYEGLAKMYSMMAETEKKKKTAAHKK